MAKVTSSGGNLAIEIKGYNRVRNTMRKMIAAHPDDVNDVMRRWAEDTRMFLKRRRYPTRSGSKYRRTGRLASSWKKVQVKPAVWAITNDAKGPRSGFYARYVVGVEDGPGDQRQAWMHRKIWWTADKEIENVHVPELTLFLSERYIEIWGSP